MGKMYSDNEKNDIVEMFKKGQSSKQIQEHCRKVYGTERKLSALMGVVKAAKLPPIKEFVKSNAHIITGEPLPELKTARKTLTLPVIESGELDGFVPKI